MLVYLFLVYIVYSAPCQDAQLGQMVATAIECGYDATQNHTPPNANQCTCLLQKNFPDCVVEDKTIMQHIQFSCSGGGNTGGNQCTEQQQVPIMGVVVGCGVNPNDEDAAPTTQQCQCLNAAKGGLPNCTLDGKTPAQHVDAWCKGGGSTGGGDMCTQEQMAVIAGVAVGCQVDPQTQGDDRLPAEKCTCLNKLVGSLPTCKLEGGFTAKQHVDHWCPGSTGGSGNTGGSVPGSQPAGGSGSQAGASGSQAGASGSGSQADASGSSSGSSQASSANFIATILTLIALLY